MAHHPTQLSKRCDVCGGIIQNTGMAQALAGSIGPNKYMCVTCKAVYAGNGVRDMSYPSIYDSPDPAFDAMHRRALALAPRPVPPPAAPESRLAKIGLTVNAVVQVYVPSAGWLYANAADYDSPSGSLRAQLPGQSPCWFAQGSWRDPMQALPSPVLAPPSQAKASRGTRKAKAIKLAPMPVPGYKVWTYDKKGKALACTITADDGVIEDMTIGLKRKRGGRNLSLPVILHHNRFSGKWHAFHALSGAMLGTAGSRTELTSDLVDDLAETDVTDLERQLNAAPGIRDAATCVTAAVFFTRAFNA